MTARRNAGRALLVLSAAGLLVSACATAPTVTPQAPALDPSYGRMKPIPNPTDDAPRAPQHTAPRTPEAQGPRAPAKPPIAAPAKPTPPSAAGRDQAKARALRAQGLEQLNRGAIDKAQDLLRQALQLDPGNALIQRDLERAGRIGRAVKAKP